VWWPTRFTRGNFIDAFVHALLADCLRQNVLVAPRSPPNLRATCDYRPPPERRVRGGVRESATFRTSRSCCAWSLVGPGWLVGVGRVFERVIDAADGLKVISCNGVSVDNLPIEALKRRGIRVMRAEG
jgi:hypothetical protein